MYEDDENEMDWETIEKLDGNLKCKEGFTKVGCCKCVHDDHEASTAASHLVPDVKAIPLTYHGMEPTATPTATPAAHTAEPNLAGWFSKSTPETTESSTKDEDKSTDQKTTEDDQ